MDDVQWDLIELLREADEAAEAMTEDDFRPVTIEDPEGGVIEVYADGSWCVRAGSEG